MNFDFTVLFDFGCEYVFFSRMSVNIVYLFLLACQTSIANILMDFDAPTVKVK